METFTYYQPGKRTCLLRLRDICRGKNFGVLISKLHSHVLRQIGSVAFCGLFIDSFTCMDPIIVFFTVYGLVLVLS